MKTYEVLKINESFLKLLSKYDIRSDYWQYLPMYEEYLSMRSNNEKYRYTVAVLAFKYNISQSSVSRIVRMFEKDVRV